MKAHPWAIALHDFVLNPKSWLLILPVIFAGIWVATGEAGSSLLFALASPMLFLGLLLIYGIVDMARGPAQTFATAAGFGVLSLLPAFDADQPVSPEIIALVFALCAGSVLGMKAVAVYVAPIWTERREGD